MANVYKGKLDIKNVRPNFKPVFVQYDHAKLEIEILDNARTFDLSRAERVEFTHVRSDNAVIIQSGEIVTNGVKKIITYEYKGTEMDVIGLVETSFAIFDADDKKVSSHRFWVEIKEDLRDETFNPAEPNYGKLEQLIRDVNDWKENGGGGGGGGQGPAGVDGKSAYQIAVEKGFIGSESEWLVSLKGERGEKGEAFKYSDFTPQQIEALRGENGENGRDGVDGYTPQKNVDYFDGINGRDGVDGKDGVNGYTPQKNVDYFDGKDGRDGVDGTNGTNGRDGVNGISAYQTAINNGFIGSESQWLASLKGERGEKGEAFKYSDFTQTQLNSLKGPKGDDGYTPQKNVDYFDGTNGRDGVNGVNGISAYQTAINNGFIGSEALWLQSLKGRDANDSYGEKFAWRYNAITGSLDLVVLP